MKLKAADATWVAVAHLHQENPTAIDFSIAEVIQRTLEEGLTDAAPITVQTHVFRHMVANLEPKAATLRMLQESSRGRRRLHWLTDSFHPQRQGVPDQVGTRLTPMEDDLPVELRPLLKWYADMNRSPATHTTARTDQLLALRGRGRGLWRDEDPDTYVRRLRSS